MTDRAPISVVIPTHGRLQRLLETLERLFACDPQPEEVLVHVDGGDSETGPSLKAAYPSVIILHSSERRGPGGGRNKLIREAHCEYVASFDDDSYPLDHDFFARAVDLLEGREGVALVSARCFERGEPLLPRVDRLVEARAFPGGAVVFRRSAFLEIEGYCDLQHSYGMEETDVALQLLDAGYCMMASGDLRVYHDADLSRHAAPEVNAAEIRNAALLAFLRYPWPYALTLPFRVFKRVSLAVSVKRFRGIGTGLLSIPATLWSHRRLRRPVRRGTIRRYLELGEVEKGT